MNSDLIHYMSLYGIRPTIEGDIARKSLRLAHNNAVMTVSGSITDSDRLRVWSDLEEVAYKSQGSLHIPVSHDGQVRPYCRLGKQSDDESEWTTKSTTVFPGREDSLCGKCLQLWVNYGKPKSESVGVGMTVHQRNALETAYNAGYFEWPREADLGDVADELGLTEPTVSEHVTRALGVVVATVSVDELEELTDRQSEVLTIAAGSGLFEWPRQISKLDIAEEIDLSSATVHQHLRAALKKTIETSGLIDTELDTDDRAQPPDDPLEQLEGYLRFIDILPDEINARVGRYIDPFTGERRQFRYDNLVVLAEIHHLHKELCSVPTSTDLEEHGEISLGVYQDRFGTFPRAVEAAGFEPRFVGAQQKARYLAEYEELVDPDKYSL